MGKSDKKKGELIEKGVKVVTSGNVPVKLNYLISDEGGQGDVYHVSFRGQDYAMKWYCKNADDVIGGLQYDTISKMCGEDKRPSEKFVWPLFLVTEENPCKGKRFGYLMELLPKNYYEMNDYLRMDGDTSAVRFKSYNAMMVAGMNIAYGMQKLHLKGFSYKDLNPKNFALNPESGDALIIDNDNVSVDGGLCTVKGMKGYMAPEIPRSKYKKSPTIETDYYSLATILYRLFLWIIQWMESFGKRLLYVQMRLRNSYTLLNRFSTSILRMKAIDLPMYMLLMLFVVGEQCRRKFECCLLMHLQKVLIIREKDLLKECGLTQLLSAEIN